MGENMDKKINLELFRFDVKTDYLPYFAKLIVKLMDKSHYWIC